MFGNQTINDASSQRALSEQSSHGCCFCDCHLKTVESSGQGLVKGTKERISKDKNRINVKSKRKRFLFKKAIELSQMCDLQIMIVVHDQIVDRLTTYCSGKIEDGIFSTQEALKLVSQRTAEKRSLKQFTDDDYHSLSTAESIKK